MDETLAVRSVVSSLRYFSGMSEVFGVGLSGGRNRDLIFTRHDTAGDDELSFRSQMRDGRISGMRRSKVDRSLCEGSAIESDCSFHFQNHRRGGGATAAHQGARDSDHHRQDEFSRNHLVLFLFRISCKLPGRPDSAAIGSRGVMRSQHIQQTDPENPRVRKVSRILQSQVDVKDESRG